MTKEQLKIYLEEAVDALSNTDLQLLFPDAKSPDLYTIAQEMIGLRGEVKRLNQSSLKVTNDIQGMMLSLKESQAEIAQLAEETGEETVGIDEDLKQVLQQLIEQDAMQQRTSEHLQSLPELKWTNMTAFRTQFASWQEGHRIGHQQWQRFIKSIGLYQIGLVGTKFDPQYHEAIATREDPMQPDNIILDTEVIGYLYKQQLVQRAKVVVNKHKVIINEDIETEVDSFITIE